ncbi:Flp pilus assembly protein%2C protease CpaA [uncultured Roseburia sp.]|nr:Flp pilus assembly protein%2C protease CpaA [uncultured Roseburia sp.]
MIIIECLFMVALISLGIIVSISDVKDGYIYNKTLLFFAMIAIVLEIIYYGYFARDLLWLFVMNLGIITFIGMILFYTHSFAGGDCKLTIVMAMLYPANYYLVYGKVEMTLYFALCIAILYGYFYLLGFSIYAVVKGRIKITKEYVKGYFASFFKSFISATGYICALNLLFMGIGIYGIYVNKWIPRIVCMMTAWLIGKSTILKKWSMVFGIYIIDIIVGILLGYIPFSFNLENYILVMILLLCQMMIRTSLYDEVQITDLKKGMILSSVSSMIMQNSRVRGLPPVSSEDLKSRLTEEQIASIGRWAGSRNIVSVTVVRKIPFAIFIFGGFLSYFIIWRVVR